jgi:hypothetical protein
VPWGMARQARQATGELGKHLAELMGTWSRQVPACPGMVRGTMGQKLAYYHQEDLGHKCEDSDLWDGSTLLIFSDLQ